MSSQQASLVCRGDLPHQYRLCRGFVDHMSVEATFFTGAEDHRTMVEELSAPQRRLFPSSLQQLGNVCGMGGVAAVVGLPDMHTGYGFPIGCVAGVDMADPRAVVSPGGIGFDINCGVRVIRTNLLESDIPPDVRERLAQRIFDHIPVGTGSEGMIAVNAHELKNVLEQGMDWALHRGYAWAEDRERCEEFGRMLTADASAVSARAMTRGMNQMGTLGAGNHFIEVQIVDRIADPVAARRMGIETVGQVVCMLHSGSRGLGHQVATDALVAMEKHMAERDVHVNDPQLACGILGSDVAQQYLSAMACAANFAWANRCSMTHCLRMAMSEVMGQSADDLDMQLVYDVSHNIAKVEEHLIGGRQKTLLVHRKGATRCFPPWHPQVCADYQDIGQPAPIGGSMGTASYILLPWERCESEKSLLSCCHGAGRAHSRASLRRRVDHREVIDALTAAHVSIRVASPHLLMEECSDGYKDVNDVVAITEAAGMARQCVRMRPLVVVKG